MSTFGNDSKTPDRIPYKVPILYASAFSLALIGSISLFLQRKSNEKTKENISKLNEELSRVDYEIHKLSEILPEESFSNEVIKLEAELDESRRFMGRLEKLEKELVSREEERKRSEFIRGNLKLNKKELEDRIKKLKEKIAIQTLKFNQEFDTKKQELESSMSRLESVEERLKEILAGQELGFNEKKQELESCRERLERELEEQMPKFHERQQASESRLEAMRKEFAEKESAFKDSTFDAKEQLESHIKELEEKLISRELKFNEEKQQLELFKSKHMEARSRVEELKKTKEMQEQQLQSLEKELGKLEEKAPAMTPIEILIKELQDLRNDFENHKRKPIPESLETFNRIIESASKAFAERIELVRGRFEESKRAEEIKKVKEMFPNIGIVLDRRKLIVLHTESEYNLNKELDISEEIRNRHRSILRELEKPEWLNDCSETFDPFLDGFDNIAKLGKFSNEPVNHFRNKSFRLANIMNPDKVLEWETKFWKLAQKLKEPLNSRLAAVRLEVGREENEQKKRNDNAQLAIEVKRKREEDRKTREKERLRQALVAVSDKSSI
jgi:hypothetical protein